MSNFKHFITLCIIFISLHQSLHADVVKPALIEINVDTTGTIDIEIRASIEALLTGINGKYKNTKDAPNADGYDTLRALQAEELKAAFTPFSSQFLQAVSLTNETGKVIPLTIQKVDIPEPGYTKVPRISTIKLTSSINLATQSLKWYYPLAFGDNAVRLRQVDQSNQQWHWSEWQWLRNDKTSEAFSLTEIVAKRPIHQVVFEYIRLGFEHIIPMGTDHILFILALFFFSRHIKPLLWQVTMFTIAHTLTLGLSMNGIISLPSNIVEPLIALSIAYAGLENIFAKQLHRSRLILVFGFGLLHGMGFATMLSDFGMPDDAFATALISFNIGVEVGQLTIIASAYFLLSYWFQHKSWYRKSIIIPISLFISITGLYWFIERIQM